MPPGPKPKPRQQRIAEGNPGKRKLPDHVAMGGKPELVKPPKHLSKYAKQFWRDAVPTLNEVGLLDKVDTAALEMMATLYSRVRECQDIVKKEGPMTTGSQGQPREHPAINTERQAMATFLRYAEHYALTPVARTRLGLAELQRRSMARDVEDSLGPPKLEAA